jgi:hypothetical protein
MAVALRITRMPHTCRKEAWRDECLGQGSFPKRQSRAQDPLLTCGFVCVRLGFLQTLFYNTVSLEESRHQDCVRRLSKD